MAAARLACMNKIDELTQQVNRGDRLKWLLFWGHRPHPDGRLSASCLSQWWPAPFTVDGVAYATAEHWMMAAKARLFGDAEAERAALAARTPAEAKKVGRLVRDFDDAVWQRERFGIVVEGSVHKFSSNEGLRAYLLRGQPGGPRLGHRARRRRPRRPRPGPLARAQPAWLRPDGGPGATARRLTARKGPAPR